MVYRRPPSRFGINSLSVKLSLLISAICLIAGVCAAALMLKSEEKQLVFEEHEVLKESNELLIKQFKNLLNTKIKVAQQANIVVGEQLFSDQSSLISNKVNTLQLNNDGTIRSASTDGLSAAFIPQTSYTPFYKQLISDSETLWKIISPTLTQDFFNFYLITKDNFIRIAPPNEALNAPANYTFTQSTRFNYAKALTNPQHRPVWSKVYYDTIWHKWAISLTVPIYKEGEFLGVTGSDIALKTLISQLPIGGKEKQLVVFDSQGQLLAHPNLTQSSYAQYGKAGKKLLPEDFIDPTLQVL